MRCTWKKQARQGQEWGHGRNDGDNLNRLAGEAHSGRPGLGLGGSSIHNFRCIMIAAGSKAL